MPNLSSPTRALRRVQVSRKTGSKTYGLADPKVAVFATKFDLSPNQSLNNAKHHRLFTNKHSFAPAFTPLGPLPPRPGLHLPAATTPYMSCRAHNKDGWLMGCAREVMCVCGYPAARVQPCLCWPHGSTMLRVSRGTVEKWCSGCNVPSSSIFASVRCCKSLGAASLHQASVHSSETVAKHTYAHLDTRTTTHMPRTLMNAACPIGKDYM